MIRGWHRTVSLAERPQESRRARACYARLPRQVVHDPDLAKELPGSIPLDEGGRLVVDFGLCPFGMLHVLILDHVAIEVAKGDDEEVSLGVVALMDEDLTLGAVDRSASPLYT